MNKDSQTNTTAIDANTKLASSFSLSTIYGFLDFEKQQVKTVRGSVEMYDVKGCHKYLTFSELFEWYVKYH